MKSTYYFRYLLIFLLLIFSCKKKVENYNTDYIGSWYAETGEGFIILDIDKNSYGEYNYTKTTGDHDNIKGTIRVNNHKLSIGMYKFKIDSKPEKIFFETKNDSVYLYYNQPTKLATWKMSLTSPLLYGNEKATYYK
ncbi:MAG: hypothetical protein A2033_13795 [Bacteroidetes bacterium GWA2_31_9]|nr:MAG: hypothetical protein A2033_13795 [Bacteroidetes bacterium GWA2_31_9]